MTITIIDDMTYEKYLDIITYVYDLTEEKIRNIEKNISPIMNQKVIDKEVLYNKIMNYDVNSVRKGNEIILFVGKLANILLQNDIIYACTIFVENDFKCFITWREDVELLERVVLHELCHVSRMNYNKITSQVEYFDYLTDPLNVLYEEILAISIEKKYFPHIKWEEIVKFDEHKNFSVYELELKGKNINSLESVYMLIKEHIEEPTYIHFLAYYFSKKMGIDTKVLKLWYMNTKEAMQMLIFLYPKIGEE